MSSRELQVQEDPAFDLHITLAIKNDFREKISLIYNSIRSDLGDENPVLEECGE